jgi:hypothetical protein
MREHERLSQASRAVTVCRGAPLPGQRSFPLGCVVFTRQDAYQRMFTMSPPSTGLVTSPRLRRFDRARPCVKPTDTLLWTIRFLMSRNSDLSAGRHVVLVLVARQPPRDKDVMQFEWRKSHCIRNADMFLHEEMRSRYVWHRLVYNVRN